MGGTYQAFQRSSVSSESIRTAQMTRPEALISLLGYTPKSIALFEEALRHRSILRAQPEPDEVSNERLEFLGDAVLGVIVSDYLYAAFPHNDEGFLTRLRAKLVSGQNLAAAASAMGLGRLVMMSPEMRQHGGEENTSILSDAFEALVAALYLDGGMAPARTFVHRVLLVHQDLARLAQRLDNYKSALLEFAQAQGWPQPTYRVVATEGSSHEPIFTVDVLLGAHVVGTGRASNKKQAEQRAAEQGLETVQQPTFSPFR